MEIAKLNDEYEKVATRCGEPTAQLRALEPGLPFSTMRDKKKPLANTVVPTRRL